MACYSMGHGSNQTGTLTDGIVTRDGNFTPGSPIIYGVARRSDGDQKGNRSSRLVAEIPPATARHFVEVPVEVMNQPSLRVVTPRPRGDHQPWTSRPLCLGRVQSLPPASVVPECTWQWPQAHQPNAARGGSCIYKNNIATVYSAWQPSPMPPSCRSTPGVARASSVPGGAWMLRHG